MTAMFPGTGKLLTVEQSRRLALMDKLSRQEYIAEIVDHLRRVSRGRFQSSKSPRQWYGVSKL